MSDGDTRAIDRRLLAAHSEGDLATLVRLYREAGERAEADGDRDRAAFFLTHAWIYALEAGLGEAEVLRSVLRKWGRAA
ncbi:MAG: hypothetical protein HKN98_09015 [Silicimonas sp.]|nr:hypothetical protein [Silicimonas sp.]NND21489.1 hypothetical protein [Silicimonas sp.]NNF92290.1 hypothetical protein [Boseongicola sp.]NNL34708.1 hypothetical protein [Silicimonas sp.]